MALLFNPFVKQEAKKGFEKPYHHYFIFEASTNFL